MKKKAQPARIWTGRRIRNNAVYLATYGADCT